MVESKEGGNVIEPKIEEKESDVDGFLSDFREDHTQLGEDLWEAQWGKGHDEAQTSHDMFEARRLYEIKLKRTWDVAKPDEKNEIAKRLVKDGDMEIMEDLLQYFDTLDEEVREEVLNSLADHHYKLLKQGREGGWAWRVWEEMPRDVKGKVMLKLANGSEEEKEYFERIVDDEI